MATELGENVGIDGGVCLEAIQGGGRAAHFAEQLVKRTLTEFVDLTGQEPKACRERAADGE
jgi:hypothetical protein